MSKETNKIYFFDKSNTQKSNRFNSPSKVIFAEPYDVIPNYYLDNNFNRTSGVNNTNFNQQNIDASNKNSSVPFTSILNGGIGGIFNSIISGLGTGGGINNILSNPEMLGIIAKLFLGQSTKSKPKHNTKATDFNLDDYTRVE